jgi:hypothetical protein
MKFQLLHRAVKGTPVVSLNTVMRVVHILLLARHIHNARILPTAAASRPARLRRSLPAAALLFSSPTAPCVTTVTRTWLLACGRTSGQPKDGWRGSIDVVPGHDNEPAGRLKPRAPPTITRTTTSFTTEVSPAWNPSIKIDLLYIQNLLVFLIGITDHAGPLVMHKTEWQKERKKSQKQHSSTKQISL